MRYVNRMTDTDASSDMDTTDHAPSSRQPLRVVAIAAAAAILGAALLLWTRFGEGVYARMLVDAFIACF